MVNHSNTECLAVLDQCPGQKNCDRGGSVSTSFLFDIFLTLYIGYSLNERVLVPSKSLYKDILTETLVNKNSMHYRIYCFSKTKNADHVKISFTLEICG